MVERGVVVKPEQQGGGGELFMPPGFRFHPTDEEIITSYLLQKLLNPSFTPRAMGEVNLNKCEPWDLPSKAKMGEKEWYFFCHKDMKYPTGMRTNRATEKGYWKATGKDREIFKPAPPASSSASATGRELVGMKKTLVFYMGRAPRGSKTNWVMHEFRLEGKYANNSARLRTKDEWVVCKVFNKDNNHGGEDNKKQEVGGGAAAAVEQSSVVGTPNVSSISVEAATADDGAEDDDGFINSMINNPAVYFNSTTTSSSLPAFSTASSSTMNNAAAAADYSAISSTAAAATANAARGSFVDLLPSYTFGGDMTTTSRNNLLMMNQQAAAAVVTDSAAAVTTPVTNSSYDVSSLFSWNLPHAAAGQQSQNPLGGGSSSYNLQNQLAMMARALGGGGLAPPNPNFASAAAGLPTSSSATGNSQHNSALGRGGYYYN